MLSHVAYIAKKRQELEEKQVIGSPNGLCTYFPPPVKVEPKDPSAGFKIIHR